MKTFKEQLKEDFKNGFGIDKFVLILIMWFIIGFSIVISGMVLAAYISTWLLIPFILIYFIFFYVMDFCVTRSAIKYS